MHVELIREDADTETSLITEQEKKYKGKCKGEDHADLRVPL
jgi:hypothetical protein